MVKKIYMKSALITGGLGFIGSELAKSLLKKKIVNKCIILDNFGSFISPLKSNFKDYRQQRLENVKNIIIERGDANNQQITLKLLQKYSFDYIYKKYERFQKYYCDKMNLTPTNIVTLGIGGKKWAKYNRGGKKNRLCLSSLYEKK